MFANIVWPPKLANIPPCILIKIIDGNSIFSHSLAKVANMPQGKKVGKLDNVDNVDSVDNVDNVDNVHNPDNVDDVDYVDDVSNI